MFVRAESTGICACPMDRDLRRFAGHTGAGDLAAESIRLYAGRIDTAAVVTDGEIVHLQVQIARIRDGKLRRALCGEGAGALQLIRINIDIAAGYDDIRDLNGRKRDRIQWRQFDIAGFIFRLFCQPCLFHFQEQQLSLCLVGLIGLRRRIGSIDLQISHDLVVAGHQSILQRHFVRLQAGCIKPFAAFCNVDRNAVIVNRLRRIILAARRRTFDGDAQLVVDPRRGRTGHIDKIVRLFAGDRISERSGCHAARSAGPGPDLVFLGRFRDRCRAFGRAGIDMAHAFRGAGQFDLIGLRHGILHLRIRIDRDRRIVVRIGQHLQIQAGFRTACILAGIEIDVVRAVKGGAAAKRDLVAAVHRIFRFCRSSADCTALRICDGLQLDIRIIRSSESDVAVCLVGGERRIALHFDRIVIVNGMLTECQSDGNDPCRLQAVLRGDRPPGRGLCRDAAAARSVERAVIHRHAGVEIKIIRIIRGMYTNASIAGAVDIAGVLHLILRRIPLCPAGGDRCPIERDKRRILECITEPGAAAADDGRPYGIDVQIDVHAVQRLSGQLTRNVPRTAKSHIRIGHKVIVHLGRIGADICKRAAVSIGFAFNICISGCSGRQIAYPAVRFASSPLHIRIHVNFRFCNIGPRRQNAGDIDALYIRCLLRGIERLEGIISRAVVCFAFICVFTGCFFIGLHSHIAPGLRIGIVSASTCDAADSQSQHIHSLGHIGLRFKSGLSGSKSIVLSEDHLRTKMRSFRTGMDRCEIEGARSQQSAANAENIRRHLRGGLCPDIQCIGFYCIAIADGHYAAARIRGGCRHTASTDQAAGHLIGGNRDGIGLVRQDGHRAILRIRSQLCPLIDLYRCTAVVFRLCNQCSGGDACAGRNSPGIDIRRGAVLRFHPDRVRMDRTAIHLNSAGPGGGKSRIGCTQRPYETCCSLIGLQRDPVFFIFLHSCYRYRLSVEIRIVQRHIRLMFHIQDPHRRTGAGTACRCIGVRYNCIIGLGGLHSQRTGRGNIRSFNVHMHAGFVPAAACRRLQERSITQGLLLFFRQPCQGAAEIRTILISLVDFFCGITIINGSIDCRHHDIDPGSYASYGGIHCELRNIPFLFCTDRSSLLRLNPSFSGNGRTDCIIKGIDTDTSPGAHCSGACISDIRPYSRTAPGQDIHRISHNGTIGNRSRHRLRHIIDSSRTAHAGIYTGTCRSDDIFEMTRIFCPDIHHPGVCRGIPGVRLQGTFCGCLRRTFCRDLPDQGERAVFHIRADRGILAHHVDRQTYADLTGGYCPLPCVYMIRMGCGDCSMIGIVDIHIADCSSSLALQFIHEDCTSRTSHTRYRSSGRCMSNSLSRIGFHLEITGIYRVFAGTSFHRGFRSSRHEGRIAGRTNGSCTTACRCNGDSGRIGVIRSPHGHVARLHRSRQIVAAACIGRRIDICIGHFGSRSAADGIDIDCTYRCYRTASSHCSQYRSHTVRCRAVHDQSFGLSFLPAFLQLVRSNGLFGYSAGDQGIIAHAALCFYCILRIAFCRDGTVFHRGRRISADGIDRHGRPESHRPGTADGTCIVFNLFVALRDNAHVAGAVHLRIIADCRTDIVGHHIDAHRTAETRRPAGCTADACSRNLRLPDRPDL